MLSRLSLFRRHDRMASYMILQFVSITRVIPYASWIPDPSGLQFKYRYEAIHEIMQQLRTEDTIRVERAAYIIMKNKLNIAAADWEP